MSSLALYSYEHELGEDTMAEIRKRTEPLGERNYKDPHDFAMVRYRIVPLTAASKLGVEKGWDESW